MTKIISIKGFLGFKDPVVMNLVLIRRNPVEELKTSLK